MNNLRETCSSEMIEATKNKQQQSRKKTHGRNVVDEELAEDSEDAQCLVSQRERQTWCARASRNIIIICYFVCVFHPWLEKS